MTKDYQALNADAKLRDNTLNAPTPFLKLFILRNQLDERFDELEYFTNIKFLYKNIQSEVVDKYKSELIDDICRTY